VKKSDKISILILEGAVKFTYIYDFVADTFTFNEAFAQHLALDDTVMEDGIEWLSSIIMDNDTKQETLEVFNQIKIGEVDFLDIKIRIIDHAAHCVRWLHLRGKSQREDGGKSTLLAGSITDITDDMRRYELNELIINGTVACTFVFDLTKDVYEFSSEVFDLLKIPSRKFKNGRDTWLNHIVPSDRPTFISSIEKVISGESDEFRTEVRIIVDNNTYIWVAMLGKTSTTEIAGTRIIVGSIINLDEMANFREYTQETGKANKMSGLPNRLVFLQRGYQVMSEDTSNFGGKGGFIILIDIDNFSAINSIHGLSVGDRIMSEFGNILSGLIRDTEFLYHFGNNLFAISSCGQEKDHAKWLCETIPKITSGGILFGDAFIKMTVSIGVADFVAGEEPTDILMNAEMALTKAKEQKDAVRFYVEDYREAHAKRIFLEAALLSSVDAGFVCFEVFYQPIFSVAHNMFVGAEALLRWRNADGQIVSPADVIPALQNLGVFHLVETWVFRTAAVQCAIWKKLTQNEEFTININMSPQRASSGNVAKEVLEIMQNNSLSLSNIYLELTEESVVMSSQSGESVLEDLRQLGTRIALDDFGTGYSSLGHLRHLPICKLKIDRSFVTDIETDKTSENFLNTLINLAHIMNYVVCVEGVETLEQARILSRMGAEYLQGFYFSRPIPASQLEQDFLMDASDPQTFTRWHEEIWGTS